jgi:hypothetical protein
MFLMVLSCLESTKRASKCYYSTIPSPFFQGKSKSVKQIKLYPIKNLPNFHAGMNGEAWTDLKKGWKL